MKFLFLLCGFLALGMGFFGVVLPLLPSFPFLVMSAFCFMKSSERLHHWLIHTEMYQKIVVPFKDEKRMTMKNKGIVMMIITFLMCFGFVMMHKVVVGRIVLVCVWLFHLYYFMFYIKTRSR